MILKIGLEQGDRIIMEFWESSFIEKQTMWGFEPTESAILTKDFLWKTMLKTY